MTIIVRLGSKGYWSQSGAERNSSKMSQTWIHFGRLLAPMLPCTTAIVEVCVNSIENKNVSRAFFTFCWLLDIRLLQFVKFSNIEEDTPSYHRRYDFFVSKFSSMCHSGLAKDEERIRSVQLLQLNITDTYEPLTLRNSNS